MFPPVRPLRRTSRSFAAGARTASGVAASATAERQGPPAGHGGRRRNRDDSARSPGGSRRIPHPREPCRGGGRGGWRGAGGPAGAGEVAGAAGQRSCCGTSGGVRYGGREARHRRRPGIPDRPPRRSARSHTLAVARAAENPPPRSASQPCSCRGVVPRRAAPCPLYRGQGAQPPRGSYRPQVGDQGRSRRGGLTRRLGPTSSGRWRPREAPHSPPSGPAGLLREHQSQCRPVSVGCEGGNTSSSASTDGVAKAHSCSHNSPTPWAWRNSDTSRSSPPRGGAARSAPAPLG